MPEAIATTKRKFYKALDSLSNASAPVSSRNTSTPSIKPPSEPVAKRVRRDVSGSTIGQPLQVTYLSTTRTSETNQGKSSINGEKSTTPNFSPWSHDSFLTRLKTFSSVSQWHPKPEAIGEVAWAKRGWVCVHVNTVACRGGCEKRVVVDLTPRARDKDMDADDGEGTASGDDDEDDMAGMTDFQASLVRRYEDLVVSGHAEGCLWRRSGCSDDIYHLQVVRPAIWQPALSQRFTSLLKVQKAICGVNFRGVESLEGDGSTNVLSTEQLVDLLPESLLPSTPETSPETKAKMLQIALHGWRGSIESSNNLLTCTTCFQRIGLWMYQPGYKSVHHVPNDGTATEQEQEDAVTIDLLEMHREHCPWRNSDSQKASGSLADLTASQILLRVVGTFAREQRRRRDERHEIDRAQGHGQEEAVGEGELLSVLPQSKDEVARLDKERESRLRRLKNLFHIKRRGTVKTSTGFVSKLSSITSK